MNNGDETILDGNIRNHFNCKRCIELQIFIEDVEENRNDLNRVLYPDLANLGY